MTDIGPTSRPGDGPGWMMRPGVLLPSTTADGFITVARGVGLRALSMSHRYTLPLWSHGLVALRGV